MRTYILTKRERDFVEQFLEDGKVAPGDRSLWFQLRHQFKKNSKILEMDLAMLEQFIYKPRRRDCFGSSDVLIVEGKYKAKCVMCGAESECLEEAIRRQRFNK